MSRYPRSISIFFSKIRTPRLENLYIFNIKTLTLSLTSEESVHQSEAFPLQFVNERNFWRQFYEKVSRRHKVSNTMGVAHFSAKFRTFYQNVGCIGGKLYCAQSRSKTLSFKTKNFSFLEEVSFLEFWKVWITEFRLTAHIKERLPSPYDGKLARFSLEL